MNLRPSTIVLLVPLMCTLWSPTPQASADPVFAAWSPLVSVVWPHDTQGRLAPVVGATAVNVSVWPTVTVHCGLHPGTSLWMAKNNEPAVPIPIEGQLHLHAFAGGSFPSLEFNDVPVNLTVNAQDRYTFMAGNYSPASNVWVHAADPRTYFPHVTEPVGTGTPLPGQLDARIQIVFPHNSAGHPALVEQATFVNIAVDIFLHGTLLSVPVDFQPDGVALEEAVGNRPYAEIRRNGQKVTYIANEQTYPRWVFNDIPVHPDQQYHFLAFVAGEKILSPYSSIWTHAADARTIQPAPTVPPPCVP